MIGRQPDKHSSFCAICCDDIASTEKPRREPLGKDNALVDVCARCATETVRAPDRYRGYQPGGGLISQREAREAAKRVVGEERWARDTRDILNAQRAPGAPSEILSDSAYETRHVANTRRGGLKRRAK